MNRGRGGTEKEKLSESPGQPVAVGEYRQLPRGTVKIS